MKKQQIKLTDCYITVEEGLQELLPSIEASGDPMMREKSEGILRIALQNPNGIRLSDMVEVLPEVVAADELDIDIMALPETKLCQEGRTKEVLQRQLNVNVGSSLVIEASAPKLKDNLSNDYQPGGVMLAMTGRIIGRKVAHFRDPMGRFVWVKLRGSRGEGIIVIVAYRVCQKKGTVSGTTTAYTQQINLMLDEELEAFERLSHEDRRVPSSLRKQLDPRSRVLADLRKLIQEERQRGFRPILCMDANEDWNDEKLGKDLSKFLAETQLCDPLFDKFQHQGLAKSTYARGKRRIDFIFVDTSIVPAIRKIGTLGLHQAMVSDHVMVYADLDEDELFQGKINRPVRVPCREFLLAQADKCEAFLKAFKQRSSERNFRQRAESLYAEFQSLGMRDSLVERYNTLDNEIREHILGVAGSKVKKKFGYNRSPELGRAGMVLHFWKSLLSSNQGRRVPANKSRKLADKLDIDFEPAASLNRVQLRMEVRSAREKLREVQFRASEARQQWLEQNAINIAKAAGAPDWRKHMEKMLQDEKDREVNRKLTGITKGSHQSLDWIEVPVGEWYYSHQKKEVYRYDRGVFESYAAWSPAVGLQPTHPWKFYTHHHLKVPHDDIVEAQIEQEGDFLILRAVHMPGEIWKTVTDPREIESLLTERNCRHLQQATVEAGRSQDTVIQDLMQGQGTDLLQEILDGEIEMDDAVDEAIRAWILSLKQTETERRLPPITGKITADEFRAAFAKVKERTSSSPSGIHYTIWKCLARDEEVSEWMALMMSMPFEFGFVNERWTKVIDVMLEKKKGVRKIHMLRIIALLEADFNTALKILFARKMMFNAEEAGLNEEQWGSRKNRMALDPAMRNMMIFEYGRYMRITVAMFAADLTACFDRMFPPISNILAGKFGVDVNALKARGDTIDALERSVRTGHGVSEVTYGNRRGAAKLAGELQGKGDVAPLYALLSSSIMDAHGTLYKGVDLPSPVTGPRIRKINNGYVDDVNTFAASMEVGLLAEEQVMYSLERGAQSLTDLNDTSGGATAFHKCATQLLGWRSDGKKLVIRESSELRIKLTDVKGASSYIQNLKAWEANKGLGYYMAIDANQATEFKERMDKVEHTCQGATSASLSYEEALRLLNSRLLAQTKYGLHLSQFTRKQCHDLSVIINETFLPLLHVHRKMKRLIVWGPKGLGGLGLNTNIWSLQAQCAAQYLVRTIRWDGIVAKDFITALNAYQMVSGFALPVLENCKIPIEYAGAGWIPMLREMFRDIDAGIWVENAWIPQKQRQHDRALMEEFAQNSDLTKKTLELANEFRIWLRVIFISEIAEVDGKTIPDYRITNDSEWRAEPEDGIVWPNTVEPTNAHRVAFRKCLRAAFCTSMAPQGRVVDYRLDWPLGQWYPVRRHVKFEAYRSKSTVYVRDEEGLRKGVPRAHQPGFYDLTGEVVDAPPLKSNPITPNYSGPGTVWTRRGRTLVRARECRVEPNILLDQFQAQSPVEELDLVSDASVFVDRCKAAVAFQIQNEAEERFFASIPMEAYPGTYSYREELRGLFLGLKLSIAKFPTCKTLTCHCDCESGIRKLTMPIQSPGQLMAPDMDVVLAIKKIVQDAGPEMQVTFKHIRGHPEKRKRKEDFTPIERMNADCDEYADICATEHTPVPFRPFEGSRCMMKIGSQWISTRVDQALQLGYVEKPLKHYISTRLEMSAEAVEHIDQDVIAAARAPHKWARTARISKLMYDCLPVGHNWRQHGAESDQCPCCGSPDETFEHLIHCCDEGLNAVRCESIEDMVETASHKRIPEAVSVVIFGILRRLTESREPTIPSESSPALLRAWESQKQIGFHNMVKGWVTKDWSRAMRAHGSKDPDGHVIMILTLLWDGFFEPVWEYRNNRLHRMENSAMSSMMRTLGDRLQWFQDNKAIVLAPRHYMLAEFRVEDVQRWDRRARRMQLLMLEKAKKIYAIECKQRVSGQQVITDLFTSRVQLQQEIVRTVSDEEE